MNIFRSFASWISLYLVAGLYFLTAGLFAFITVISPVNVKTTLKEQGTYEKVVPAVLSGASYSSEIAKSQQLPLNEPWVREAADKAFPASDLEQKGNALIDSSFDYLEGETEKPEYKLDFTSNKQALADEIGASAESRAAELPRCSPNDIPESINALSINCLPFGISPSVLAQRASSQIANDQGFLKNPVISSDNLGQATEGTVTENPLQRLAGIRTIYENRGLLQVLLPLSVIGFAALGVFSAADRLKAVRRLTRSFISSGVGLLVFGFFISFGFEKAVTAVSRDAVSRDLLSPVLIEFAQQFRNIYLVFAGLAFLIALGLFLARRRLFN